MKPEKMNTKEPYEKPKMVIEQIELATVAGYYMIPGEPVEAVAPWFGICCY